MILFAIIVRSTGLPVSWFELCDWFDILSFRA